MSYEIRAFVLTVLIWGGITQLSPSIAQSQSNDPANSGYLTDAGTVLVVGDSALAFFAPPWDPHQLHVFYAKHDSTAGHVRWYKVSDKKLYFGLDHRGHGPFVWIYYRDATGHLHKFPYAAKVKPLASEEARAVVAGGPGGDGASSDGAAPPDTADSLDEAPLPDPTIPPSDDEPVMPLDDRFAPPDDSTLPPFDPFNTSPDDEEAPPGVSEPAEPGRPFSDLFTPPSTP